MKHEARCIHIPCTCVTILREKLARVESEKEQNDRNFSVLVDKYKSLEKKIFDGLSCCCSHCSRHNQLLLNPDANNS